MGTERQKVRTWDASDRKELTDNAGGWAMSWDEVKPLPHASVGATAVGGIA